VRERVKHAYIQIMQDEHFPFFTGRYVVLVHTFTLVQAYFSIMFLISLNVVNVFEDVSDLMEEPEKERDNFLPFKSFRMFEQSRDKLP